MLENCLIIFTRYPEIGMTKTRLIPVLGEAGATALHRLMVEKTLEKMRLVIKNLPGQIRVYFTGGDAQLMADWLGNDLIYYQQSGIDLGDRMNRAFINEFTAGFSKIVLIGTDCPDLNTEIIQAAFENLANHDLVLGPAVDGGYYLIGLNAPRPSIFQNITWSSAEVYSQTRAIARQENLSVFDLPTLQDIDEPADLAWLPEYYA
jgi:rSAM/selenodomain-associated transferase 1